MLSPQARRGSWAILIGGGLRCYSGTVLRRRPLHVILDVTERCNLKCVMCYFSSVDRLRFHPMERELSADGHMPVEVFAKVAADLFPRAWRASLACAAEPLIHPRFEEIVDLAGRYRVPDLWFPTNLLALTERKMEALVAAGVNTVGVSVDGFTQESYERIRVNGRWDLLLRRLELFNEVKQRSRSRRPKLRFIFTWMRSNREQLARLPAFAVEHGAAEIDVRYVCLTEGVDNTGELLSGEDPRELDRELAAVAREAVGRGLRLASFPEFERPEEKPRDLPGRVRRRLWHLKAGLDRYEYRRHRVQEKLDGCAYPGRTYVVRPNGAVFPCQYWDREPIGLYPDDTFEAIAEGDALGRIRTGLRSGSPVGTCVSCSERQDAFYRPFRKRLQVLVER